MNILHVVYKFVLYQERLVIHDMYVSVPYVTQSLSFWTLPSPKFDTFSIYLDTDHKKPTTEQSLEHRYIKKQHSPCRNLSNHLVCISVA